MPWPRLIFTGVAMVTLSKSRRDLNRAAAPHTPMDAAAEKEEERHDSTGALVENKRSGGGLTLRGLLYLGRLKDFRISSCACRWYFLNLRGISISLMRKKRYSYF